jgi:hypothetical protein
VIAADGETVAMTAGGAIADGDMLVCLDGAGGQVVPLSSVAASLANGDPIYTIGRAQAAAASGTTVMVHQSVQLIFASIP